MTEGVGNRAIESQIGANTNRTDHKANLVDDTVGQNTAHVVFQQSVDDAVDHHEQADPDQNRLTGKQQNKGQNRGLGGKGREKYGTGWAGLRISVR